MNWKIMREVTKPVKGFEYECEAGHRWFIVQENWSSRGVNDCAECGAPTEAPQGEIENVGQVGEVAS